MADTKGWTSGPAPAPMAGWTSGPAPDLPVFKQSDTSPNELPWYSDPTSGAYHKLMDAMIDHLPTILGATGGVVGGIGGTVGGVGVGGPPAAIGGAALLGAAGEAFKELINRARGKSAPATSGDAAIKMAAQAAIQGGSQAVGEAAGPLMTKIGERVMQSAVKPGLKLLTKTPPGETPQVVKTLLDEGVNVTPAGVQRLRGLIGATNDEIATALKGSSATIAPLKVASRLSQTARRFGTQVNPQADLAAISDVGENFLTAHGAQDLSVEAAQTLKQGTYKALSSKAYGEVKGATVEAEKALARGLKEEIAAEVPGVSTLNAREGKLLEALSAVGKRVALAGNRDPVGFAWVAHSPTTFLAALFDRSPAVKSLVARGLYNAAGTTAKVSPQLIRLAVTSLASGDPDAALASSSTDPGNR